MRIDDGFSTTISFAENANVKLWEKSVTPPGVAAGGENDTTTMRNLVWRTQSPKKLKSLMQAGFTAAYDPAVLPEIVAMVGVNQEITLNFPEGETWVFWGWIDEFQPNEHTEGSQPTAQITILPSNQNDSLVETAPVYSA